MITLVNAQAGSHLYGLNHKDSDLDTMGIGINSLTEELKTTASDLPLGPNYPAIDRWLANTYEYFWRHE